MRPEAKKTPPFLEKIEKVQPVVRVFPFAIRDCDEILSDILVGKPGLKKETYIPLINIYLAQKKESSEPSAGYIAPIGGKMKLYEDPKTAGFREVYEEVTLGFIPRYDDKGFDFSDRSFSYVINKDKYKNEKREVHFMLAPIINPSVISPVYPNQDSHSKIEQIIPMTLSELVKVMKNGFSGSRPVQGHITFGTRPDVLISNKDKQEKDRLLGLCLRRLYVYENEIKQDLINKYVTIASRHGFKINPSKNFDNFLKEAKNTVGDANFTTLFEVAYEGVVMEMIMRKFRINEINSIVAETRSRDKIPTIKVEANKGIAKKQTTEQRLLKNAEIIKRNILGWNRGVDYLQYLPIFILGKVKERVTIATGSVIALKRFLYDSLAYSMVDASNLKNIIDGREIEYFKKELSNPEVLLENKLNIIENINNNLLNLLAKTFEIPREKIQNAWVESFSLLNDLGGHVQRADPSLLELYQVYSLRNEIANASLAKAILLFHEIDIKPHDKRSWAEIKYETGRQLVLFLKTLFIKSIYNEEVAKTPNPISEAVDLFFGEPITDKPEEVVLKTKHQTFRFQVNKRRMSDGNIVLVDKKPLKDFTSLVRKSFLEPLRNVKDFNAASIVLPDKYYDNMPINKAHQDENPRIVFTNNLINKFIDFLRCQYPSYNFVINDNRNTFGAYYRFNNNEAIDVSGKRVGSEASKIIRRKFYIEATNETDNKSYNMELSFYPFEKLSDKTDDKLWGWLEKTADDPNYVLRRMFFPLGEGMPSLYDLLFPPCIYPAQTKNRKEISKWEQSNLD